MRPSCHQQPIFLAARLTFGAVDEDHCRAWCRSDRPPFQAHREIRTASPGQPAARDQVDERAVGIRERAQPADVFVESFGPSGKVAPRQQSKIEPQIAHGDSLLWTAASNSARGPVKGSGEPATRRYTSAVATAPTQMTVRTKNHGDHVSVPVPRPWTTPSGHAAYVSQCTQRHAAWPIKPRTRLVATMASKSSKEMGPKPHQKVLS